MTKQFVRINNYTAIKCDLLFLVATRLLNTFCYYLFSTVKLKLLVDHTLFHRSSQKAFFGKKSFLVVNYIKY